MAARDKRGRRLVVDYFNKELEEEAKSAVVDRLAELGADVPGSWRLWIHGCAALAADPQIPADLVRVLVREGFAVSSFGDPGSPVLETLLVMLGDDDLMAAAAAQLKAEGRLVETRKRLG